MEMGEAMKRMEEQLTQLSISRSSIAIAVTSLANSYARPTWSQVAGQQGLSP
jgi:hypothetical protein